MEQSNKKNQEEYSCNKTPDTLYRIGMFAGMNQVSIKTLRYYEEQGLLSPAYVDQESGYRYYVLSQMAELHQIRALREMEFSIEEIKMVRGGVGERELLMRKRKEILKEIAKLTTSLAMVESYLAEEDEMSSNQHVLIKRLPESIVATMTKRIGGYSDLFEVMPQMGMEMERLGCKCAIPEYCYTEYLEEGYKEEQVLIRSCEAVTEAKEDSDLVQFMCIPEVKEAACIFHKGPYSNFPKSYEMVLRYIEENGYQITGNIRESYIDGMWNKDSEEDWLSEIQIPVTRKE